MMGTRIAALRRSAGMSQAELARRLNVSTSTIGMYEQGRREPSADRLVALAGLFGVTTDYLLTGANGPAPDTGEVARILGQAGDDRRPLTRRDLAILFAALFGDQESLDGSPPVEV